MKWGSASSKVSDTWVFDRPQAGRMWFEGVIRNHLDVGRPDQIALIFQRRVNCRTPGRFRTRVITRGVDPGSRPYTVLLLQVFADQAELQGGTGAPHRGSHL